MKVNWGTAIILFFILFIALCIAFMVFAFHQNQDLVEDNYYEKGAGYTRQMEINTRSAIYRDSLAVQMNDSLIIFSVSPFMAEKIDSFSIYFFRPSNKLEDVRTIFKQGQYMSISKTKLSGGRYIIKASWISNHELYMLENEIIVK